MNEFSVKKSLEAWEKNALFWDRRMGDESNRFHREVVRPGVTALLEPSPGDIILDIACGNGNYSAYMAELGAEVTAFDYSKRMIELAKKRQRRFLDHISFHVVDATDQKSLLALRGDRPFTKAVSNMAVMDMADIGPLFECVSRLLEDGGIFVFATQHPCFVTLTYRYISPHAYRGISIEGQPAEQCYYHRSLQDIFAVCFKNGFAVDGFLEESYGVKEKPDVMIVRAQRQNVKALEPADGPG